MVGGQPIPVWVPGKEKKVPVWALIAGACVLVGVLLILVLMPQKFGSAGGDAGEVEAAHQMDHLMLYYMMSSGDKFPDFAGSADIPALFKETFKGESFVHIPPDLASYDWNPALSNILKKYINRQHDIWVFHSHKPDANGRYVVSFIYAVPKLVSAGELAEIEKVPLSLDTSGPGTS
jgi:hypothetical protein